MLLTLLLGFIRSAGFYFLFYRQNRPAARFRSITLIILVILGWPLLVLLQLNIEVHSFSVVLVIFDFAFIFICALLGASRSRMLAAAAFVCDIIIVADLVVVFFMGHVIYQIVNAPTVNDAIVQFPQLYYTGFFLNSIITAGCCLIAAYWMRNTQTKPPLKICLLFSLLFLLSAVIICAWYYDLQSNEEVIIKHVSFFAFGLMGVLLLGVQLVLFYLYTKLVNKTKKETETPIAIPNDYLPFIANLSKRELELITAVLAGNTSYKAIAAALNISVNTVKAHLKRIYRVTGVSNITALCRLFHGFTLTHP